MTDHAMHRTILLFNDPSVYLFRLASKKQVPLYKLIPWSNHIYLLFSSKLQTYLIAVQSLINEDIPWLFLGMFRCVKRHMWDFIFSKHSLVICGYLSMYKEAHVGFHISKPRRTHEIYLRLMAFSRPGRRNQGDRPRGSSFFSISLFCKI